MTIGSRDTGKTCLIKRFCKEKFESRYITTIGLDYGVNPLTMHGRNVNVSFSAKMGLKLAGNDSEGHF